MNNLSLETLFKIYHLINDELMNEKDEKRLITLYYDKRIAMSAITKKTREITKHIKGKNKK